MMINIEKATGSFEGKILIKGSVILGGGGGT